MLEDLLLLLSLLRAAARDREALVAENLLLRHQLTVPSAAGGAAIRLTPINASHRLYSRLNPWPTPFRCRTCASAPQITAA